MKWGHINDNIEIVLSFSPDNGEVQGLIKRGKSVEVTKDGLYEISVSFIFQSVGGKRIWGNLMRKHKDSETQNMKGNIQLQFWMVRVRLNQQPYHNFIIFIFLLKSRHSIDIGVYWCQTKEIVGQGSNE